MSSNFWPSDDFASLIDRILDYIGRSFEIGKFKHDRTLQDGLLTYIVPACYRQRFHIWFPVSLAPTSLPEQDEREIAITNEIMRLVFAHTGVNLPERETDYLVALLRAAIIRNRTYKFERIIVVCPSGMAIAQLVVLSSPAPGHPTRYLSSSNEDGLRLRHSGWIDPIPLDWTRSTRRG